MSRLHKRVEALATLAPIGAGEVWHRLIWNVGQPWADVLADYGEDRIRPGDHISLVTVMDSAEGRPVRDPIRERDKAVAEAWLELHEQAGARGNA